MAEALLSDAEFIRRLGAHPDLRRRMESLLLSVEDETGELKTADAAEMRVIQEMRQTGKVALQSWAERQADRTSQEIKQTAGVWREGKKNSAGTPPLATSASTNPNTEMAAEGSGHSRKVPKSATAAARTRSSA